jgi:hypothetical protein
MYRHLGGRADLDLGSRQVVAGGIGSGKTTELLLAYQWLQENSDALTLFIDVSSETDLSSLNYGALVASFGLHLGTAIRSGKADLNLTEDGKTKATGAYEVIKGFAFGKKEYTWVNEEDFDPNDYDDYEPEDDSRRLVVKTIEGKLVRPFPALKRDLQEIRKSLEDLIKLPRESGRQIIVIFDGLDRLITSAKFWSAVEQDFRLLQQLSVSVICTGPISILFDTDKSVTDHFSRVLHLSAISVSSSELRDVVLKRQGEQLLTTEQIGQLCSDSGGLLRDLITLGRDSAEEAYVDNADRVRDEDISKSVRMLGTSYLRGLGSQHLQLLRKLMKGGGFDITQPLAQELLGTRRVIEYSATEFRVHPSLVSVSEKIQ